jgi:hypothetical protein
MVAAIKQHHRDLGFRERTCWAAGLARMPLSLLGLRFAAIVSSGLTALSTSGKSI